MKVKYSYLDAQFNDCEEILESIRGLLRTGKFTLGPSVGEFEKRFAAVCGTRFAIGVNSGTDALLLILHALEMGSGDEVITVPNSFVATTAAVVLVGATPVFADVKEDYNIDPEQIERLITPRTKAILPVHLTGHPADMPRILEIANRHGLRVIEDAAQAIGAAIDGRPVGSWGIAAGFSLHPLKNLNVWGDGGVVVTNSESVARKIGLLRNHGLTNRDEVEVFGYNSRLDTLQAIVACHLLEKLEFITSARIHNAQAYDTAFSGMSGAITLPPRKANVRQVYHTYVIQARDRDRLWKFLADRGIDAKVHYPIPIHLQEAARSLGYKAGDFPVCESQARSILTLPVHQHMAPEEIRYVAEQVSMFYSG
ncbi:MAG: DegT/DnrJ/EryC1/StrS family aminotransferase [Deltaproteobacteria bacterium]|nr:DegT/DnrJ/EryC1/StrS family aminotransferase [Deltaproteobacteria bacterium]